VTSRLSLASRNDLRNEEPKLWNVSLDAGCLRCVAVVVRKNSIR